MPSPSQPVSSLRFAFALGLLAVAMVGGGGAGGWGDVAAQLMAVPLLVLALWPEAAPAQPMPWRQAAWALIPVLFLLWQALPLPASLALLAPARQALAGELAQAQVAPVWHVALSPIAVERAAWSLLPALALFLAALRLDARQRTHLLRTLLALALLGIVLGLAQIADGPDSALRFYRPTHTLDAVGFFANRNHQATLLAMCLPIAFAGLVWSTREYLRGHGASPLQVAAWAGAVVLLVVGVALARSRAGMVLGMLAVLASLPLGWRLRKEGHRGIGRVGAIALVLSALLVVQFGLVGILQRLELDPLEDLRWTFAQVTLEAAHEHAPWGAGVGGFVQSYQEVEGRGTPGALIVNHAHDEYLELWLEGGFAAVAAIGAFLLLLAWASWRAWRTEWDQAGLLARAAAVALWLPVLHSVVDYPLRTTAASSVFALLLATVLRQGAAAHTRMEPLAERTSA